MFKWNTEKNRQLIRERGISFDEVVQTISASYTVNDVPNWNKENSLDAYEQDILDVYESGKMERGAVSDSLITAAKATMRKNKNINIRISENDLESIKLLAAREGLPYQTLIGSLIHKYATGSLREVRS